MTGLAQNPAARGAKSNQESDSKCQVTITFK